MTFLAAVGAMLIAAPSVRASIDRAYLPSGAGDTAPVVHLAARGAKEVEVSLYEVGHPAQTLLRLTKIDGESPEPPLESPPLVAASASLRRRARESYTALWRSFRAPTRDLVKELLGLDRPIGASVLAPPVAPESRVRRGEKLLRSWRLPMGEAGWNYSDLELGFVPSGLYRVEVLAASASAEALLSVSRLSLLAVRTGEGSSILATDSVDGRPLPGVELLSNPLVGDTRHPIALGRTGPRGLWTTRAPVEGVVVGRLENQLARVTLQPEPVEPIDRAGAGVFFDRRAYRPGEAVRVWSLLRSREGGAWKIPEADQADVQLIDRRGTILLDVPVEVSTLGIVTCDLELPAGLLPGWYSIAVGWSGERRGGEILVQSQAPAEIAVRWEAPDWSPPSSPLDVNVVVKDRLGRPERGVEVHWSAEARAPGPASDVSIGPSEVIGEGVGVSRDDGRVPIRLPPALEEGVVALHAEAEDSAGRSAVADFELRRIQASIALDLAPDRRVVKPGRAPAVALEAHTLDGQPWRGRVAVHVLGVHNSVAGEAVRSEVLEKVVELDARGRGALTLPPAVAGYLEVRASLPDTGESLARASIFVTETGGDIPTTPDRLELVLDRHDYGRGDDIRMLVLTPFESGTVLVGLEPSGGPPEELVGIHGYSGVVHLKVPGSAAGARLTAAALVGGTLYRASVPVPVPERAPTLALHLSPDRPLRAGQRGGLSLGALDMDGHGVPAALEVTAATVPPASPPLGQLFLPAGPGPAALFTSSGAEDSAFKLEAASAVPRLLQPYGPSQLGQVTWEREAASSQTVKVSADDSGHTSCALHVPADAERLFVTVRGAGGPELFGERTWILPIAAMPQLTIDAPRWVRAGDQFESLAVKGEGGVGTGGCEVAVEVAGGEVGSSTCTKNLGRLVRTTAGAGPGVELSAVLAAEKLTAHRSVRVAPDLSGASPATSGELARSLAEGLIGSAETADQAELDCAAVRALGALKAPGPSPEDAVGAVARLAQEENAGGGFGSADGELRRDLAALRGLAALKESGTIIDGGLLARLQRRVEVLVERVADVDERERFGTSLQTLAATVAGEAHGVPRAPRLANADPAEVVEGNAEQVAGWLEGHRPSAAGSRALVSRLTSLVAGAGPLDASELVASLSQLDPREPITLVVGATPSRRYLQILRQPWTEGMLAADEEPAEPSLRPVDGPIPLGTELEVALAVPMASGARFACVRDYLPAGLAPMGAPEVSWNGLLVCGPVSHDRLEVTYQVRAVHVGRFQAPGPGLGITAQPGPPVWVEVTP